MAEYIEREAAYEDFEKCNSENPKWTPSRVKALIARQKAEDVSQVRHGRWNESRPALRRVNRTNIPVVECSVCGIIFCDLINNHRFTYQFCPHCGARMDGGEQ